MSAIRHWYGNRPPKVKKGSANVGKRSEERKESIMRKLGSLWCLSI
ncbi:hypothetical protein Hdeb2414_s0003g00100871 [Helianthus debilis subsp. tardiflorus]